MNRLIAELQRLYFLPDQRWHGRISGDADGPADDVVTPEIVARSLAGEASVALDPVGPDGMVRTMTIGFERAAEWEQVSKLCLAVQEDLGLPAPAISVSGRDGYRLWFSLAEPVPVALARLFLDALRRRYLADIPIARLSFHPDAAGSERLDLVPALHPETGKWSAYIDPSMGAMFVSEPGLEMAPNPDSQADLLARFKSVGAGDFRRVLDVLQAPGEPAGSAAEMPAGPHGAVAGRARSRLDVGSNFSDPKSFLLAVMNDPSASAGQRIKAAKALFPYFEKMARK